MNLRELSAHLGLSQTTVSRALNGYADVAPATRRKVVEAAERVGYRPNSGARRLATGRSQALGIAFPVDRNLLLDPHFIEFLAGVAATAGEKGYDLTVSPTTGTEDEVYRRFARTRTADAVILSGPAVEDRRIALLNGLGLPFVVHGRTQTPLPYAHVDIDNRGAFRQACRLLLDLGHRRIAHISGWQGSLTGVDRMRGFLDGLADHGLEPVACVDGRYDRATAMAVTREIFAGPERPEAVFVGNDHMAFAVLEALQHDLGLRVPEDVSVVGFDDVKMAAWRVFDLTTLRQPANEMVAAVVDMMMQLINGKPLERARVEIDSALIERGTTRKRNRE